MFLQHNRSLNNFKLCAMQVLNLMMAKHHLKIDLAKVPYIDSKKEIGQSLD